MNNKDDFYLLGKVLTKKRINLTSFTSTMNLSWKLKQEMKIIEDGEKIFLYQFSNRFDLDKVLQKAPWNFSNSLIILKKVSVTLELKQHDYSTNPFSIHLHKLPMRLRSERVVRVVSSSIGMVL
ncbi:hypothetical protein SLE2022_010180 [Rubroshorea leprosula]